MKAAREHVVARLWCVAFIVAAMLAALVPAAATAGESNPEQFSVKVAYFPMNGYYDVDASGEYTGYGVEYLNAVEQCSNVTFDYVDAGTWQNALSLLHSGEVDILAPAQMTSERVAEFSFLTYPVSYEYGCLLTLESRDDLTYEDFDSFSSLTLGCTVGQVFEDDYQLYAADNGFQAKEIKYYETWLDLNAALENGEVDAVITNMMYAEAPLKVIARFGVSPAYIMANSTQEDLFAELENAMNLINTESPEYLTDLSDKYFPQYKNIPFTKKELEYIASAPSIRVICNKNESPFSHQDGDSFHGIAISLLDRVSKICGLTFEYVPAATREDMLAGLRDGTGDLIASDTYDFTWARKEDVYQSVPYMSAQLVSIMGEANGRAAMVPGRFSTEYVRTHYDGVEVLECATVEECIEAVRSGKAGFTIINSYEASYMLGRFPNMIYSEEGLNLVQQMCLSMSKDAAPELRSILGKCLGQISEAEIYEYVSDNAGLHREVSLSTLIARYPIEVLLVTIALSAFLATLVYIIGLNRVKSKKNRELEEIAEKATDASRAKSEFLSNMSHDIRTPMNAIVNLTSLAMDDARDEARLMSDLDKIKLSSDFLLGLINDILDMSRIESGQFKLEPRVYTAQRFENYIESVMRPLFAAKEIDFVLDKREAVPAIFVDEVRFNQIFFNILSNAAKYTPSGGRVEFVIRVLRKDEAHLKAQFIVSDNGIGMAPGFVTRAFEPFEREAAVEAYTGTGLGLAITKAIVDAFGGTIDLESSLGKGTVVTVTLDMVIPDEAAIGESLSHQKMDEIHRLGFGVRGRVLVVEDHPINREVITRLLKREGFEVECAENGALAVEMVGDPSASAYQFVLMDVRMPVMDGLAATKNIRQLEDAEKASVPIIAMTADAFAEDRERCEAVGMDGYVPKPIDVSQLLLTIERVVAGQTAVGQDCILVVDDVETNISVVRAALEHDFNILEAADGREALAHLESTPGIVAVVTDIQMPNMDGIQLIERIRSNKEYDEIAVIANTQYGDFEQEERLLILGADDFVYKPTTPAIVVNRLYNALRRKHRIC